MNEMEKRVEELETWKADMNTYRAVERERAKAIEVRFDQMDKRLDKIDNHVGRIVWLIVTAIIMGAMSFIMDGGFSGGP